MPDHHKAPSIDDLKNKTVGDALRFGVSFLQGVDTAPLDARVLLKAALDADEADLIARANEMIASSEASRYAAFLQRRRLDEPAAYITGVKEFWSLEFHVTPDVLIPRNDSECLIEAAVRRRDRNEPLRILDLGAGSGCLLCALLSEFPDSEGVGVDLSDGAVNVAAENTRRLGLASRAVIEKGDWFVSVEGPFDLIIANPPYIRDSDRATLGRGVLDFEPEDALFGGPDGLGPYRRILSEIPSYLAPDGLLLMECGFDQTAQLLKMLEEAGLSGGEAFTLFDLAQRPRGVGLDRRKP